MAVWDLSPTIEVTGMEWASIKSGVSFQSPFDGTTESIEFPGERWGCALTLAPVPDFLGGEIEALFGRLAGGTERLRLGHRLRPVPRGTMRGTPTVNAAAARGAQSLLLNTDGTLLAGDFFKIGNQVFQAFQSCAPISGVLTVPLVQRVRVPVAASDAVTWDRPTALFVLPATSNRASYSAGLLNGMAVDMQEVYS